MSRILIAAAVLVALGGLVNTASAKPISNSQAARGLSMCMLEDDSKTQESRRKTKVRCCSKNLGYCITCRQDGSGRCEKTRYSISWPSGYMNTAQDPGNVLEEPARTPARKPRLNQGGVVVR